MRDGSVLAAVESVIVVTVNFRRDVFGKIIPKVFYFFKKTGRDEDVIGVIRIKRCDILLATYSVLDMFNLLHTFQHALQSSYNFSFLSQRPTSLDPW